MDPHSHSFSWANRRQSFWRLAFSGRGAQNSDPCAVCIKTRGTSSLPAGRYVHTKRGRRDNREVGGERRGTHRIALQQFYKQGFLSLPFLVLHTPPPLLICKCNSCSRRYLSHSWMERKKPPIAKKKALFQ